MFNLWKVNTLVSEAKQTSLITYHEDRLSRVVIQLLFGSCMNLLNYSLTIHCTSAHINSICDKAWARLNLMRTLKFRVSRRSLEKMHISYGRPLIEYSDSVWDNCSTESKNQLESIHIEAA